MTKPVASPQYLVVTSGTTVSNANAIPLTDYRLVGLHIPSSLHNVCYIQTAWSTTSADFGRVRGPEAVSTFWHVSSTDTPMTMAVANVVGPWPYMRVELGAATTQPMTFAVYGKR